MRLWYSRIGRRKKTRRKNQESEQLKRIGHIDGVPLFDLALRKENIFGAIDNAAKDHAKDPQVI